MKPFTGTVTEITELPLENHVAWDTRPFGAGAIIHAEKGPAMLANEQKRQPREDDGESIPSG